MLGKKVRDKVTGVEGICTGKCEYLYGCTQYNIVPAVAADSKLPDTYWFDEGRIEIIGDGVAAADVSATAPGGPNRDAPGACA